MLLLLLLWDLRLPGLARAKLLVLVLVPVGTDMSLVAGALVVLMQLLVLARARLLLHELLDRELQSAMSLLVVLVQVSVGDWPLLPRPVGKGLTVVSVMQLLVPVGRVFLLPGGGLQLVGGHMVLLEAGELRLLLLVLRPELLGRSRA
jgi:hypothetical protein